MRGGRYVLLLAGACSVAHAEEILSAIVKALFAEGLMPHGSIIDAGANTGVETCMFAALAPDRTVHSVDPLLNNIACVRSKCGKRSPNVQLLLGGLGATSQVLHVPSSKSRYAGQQISIASHVRGESPLGEHRDKNGVVNIVNNFGNQSISGQAFQVFLIDELFRTQWHGERLGFAHWDTEGNELDILRGGEKTISRDMPIFTVECAVHKSPTYTKKLLSFLESLGYQTFLIEEEAGFPLDVRNLLNLPLRHRQRLGGVVTADAAPAHTDRRNRTAPNWNASHLLQKLVAMDRLIPVTASTIFEHAYPCCATGGTCCSSHAKCCMPGLVPNRWPAFDPEMHASGLANRAFGRTTLSAHLEHGRAGA